MALLPPVTTMCDANGDVYYLLCCQVCDRLWVRVNRKLPLRCPSASRHPDWQDSPARAPVVPRLDVPSVSRVGDVVLPDAFRAEDPAWQSDPVRVARWRAVEAAYQAHLRQVYGATLPEPSAESGAGADTGR
jgi:hypothetical protein